MTTITPVDGIGYLASILLMISFSLSNIKKLRILNSFGCITFIIYGFMLSSTSWPIVITNTFIVIMNGYQLTKKED